MKRVSLFAVFVMFLLVAGGNVTAQKNLSPGENVSSPGPGNQKVLDNDESVLPGKTGDFEKAGPKSKGKKAVVKKAGAAAAGGVAVKKAKDVAGDKIKK